ncbi:TrbG/VirB9 family P-type conjugative transfer protein [Nostoc sp. CHAB 5844]|nr:TrbG/VirB9 family P-type conjugative transfer protein [Nostoc sp. CHAB 5844]
MKNIGKILALTTGLIVVSQTPVQAISTRTVYAQDIESVGISLKVWRGYGLTINFMPLGETIKQVWIGDPTRYSFTSNGNLCAKNQSDCEGSPATVIFLRQIKPIAFPNMTSSSDGSTQITIITDQRQYQFKLIAASGQPQYTSLVIKPESEKPSALPRASNERATVTRTVKPIAVTSLSNNETLRERRTAKPTATTKLSNNETVTNNRITTVLPKQELITVRRTAQAIGTTLQRNDANALVYGLALARQQGTIKPNTSTWRKVQDAIRLLRQGKDRQTAIARSGVPKQLFNQLIEAGKI